MAVIMMRLDRILTEMGAGSRQEVKKLIRKGQVTVNGNVIRKPEEKIQEESADIRCLGLSFNYEPYVYYMLNKPSGVISATEDKKEHTVLDLLPKPVRTDLFPVGRLDKDTEGLLLITNDGDLAHQLLSPKKHVDKTYEADISGIVGEADIKAFSEGVDIGDETRTLPAKLEIVSVDINQSLSSIRITIQEGRFHQIKRMFQSVGKEVLFLRRIRMGSLSLDPELKQGASRRLTPDELHKLKTTQKEEKKK